MSITVVVRITQILKDSGWVFIDNGYNFIEKVIKPDEVLPVEYSFSTEQEFEDWLEKMAIYYLT
jgi:hypothetical protein